MHPYECVFNKPERRIKKDHKIKTGIEKYYPYLFVTVGSIGATILGFKIFKHKK